MLIAYIFAFQAPPREHWNGRLLGYYVGHKRHQSSEPYAFHTVAAGRSTHSDYRLTRLQKATRYSVVVKAFNSVGSGPESHELLVETSDKGMQKSVFFQQPCLMAPPSTTYVQ